jgi:hypothetical protein
MTGHAMPSGGSISLANPRSLFSLDALTCLLMGLLLVSFADALAGLLGLPARLLLVAGILLLPCAALMYATARSHGPNRALAWLVVLGNVAWVLASIAVAATLAPTLPGLAFVLAQAGAVAVLAALELRALRGARD